jgi:DNA-binding CsgD family transcriptional regulator
VNIRSSRVRRLLSLLGEASEVSANPGAAQKHLLDGLAQLIGAVCAVRRQIRDFRPGGALEIRDSVDFGFEDDYRRSLAKYFRRCGFAHDEPVAARLLASCRELPRSGGRTVRRRDVVADREWYGSPFVAELRRPARVDDTIYSDRIVGGGHADVMGFARPWGDRPFKEEDREIVHLVHPELVRQFPLGTATRVHTLPPNLSRNWSPRERETLTLLLTGASKKSIAAELGISWHTLDGYMKAIYRRLAVHSRAELMSRAVEFSALSTRLK